MSLFFFAGKTETMVSYHRRTIHGVLVQAFDVGILLLGESGSGKSECGLKMLARGHKLIADDVVQLTVEDGKLIGRAPKAFQGIAHVRSVGILDLKRAFGAMSFPLSSSIDLVVRIDPNSEKETRAEEIILGVKVPAIDFAPFPKLDLSSFVEAAAKEKADKWIN